MRVEIARPCELHDAPLDGARDQAGDDQEAGDDDDALEQRPQAELGLARHQVDAVEGAFQPAEPAQHLEGNRQPDDESELELPGAEPAVRAQRDRDAMHHEAHQHQHRGEVQGDVDELEALLKTRKQRPQAQDQRQCHERRGQHHAGDHQAPRPARQVGALRQRAQPALDVVRKRRGEQCRRDQGDHFEHDFRGGELLEELLHVRRSGPE